MLQVGATGIEDEEEEDCLGNILYLSTIIRINVYILLSWNYFVSVSGLGLAYCLENVVLRYQS
jgi:hypothetical protein